MKIAPPVIPHPSHLSPVATPAVPATLRPGTGDAAAKTLADQKLGDVKDDASLVQQADTHDRQDQGRTLNGLLSQAAQSNERMRQLVAGYNKGLDNATRALRRDLRNLPGRALPTPENMLSHVMATFKGDVTSAYSGLQAAFYQARSEGQQKESHHLYQQIKLLRKFANPGRNRKITLKGSGRTRTTEPGATTREALYIAAVDSPLNMIGLVEALLDEMREHGELGTSLKEIRSQMAADLASAAVANSVAQTRPLMSGLTTTRHVATLLHECEHLLGRMRNKNPDLRVKPLALLRHLFTLTGKLMEPEQTRTLVELIGGKRLSHQLACLNGLRNILNLQVFKQVCRKDDFHHMRENILILSTVLTNEEQKLLQEDSALWNA
jgi:type III secretion protein W